MPVTPIEAYSVANELRRWRVDVVCEEIDKTLRDVELIGHSISSYSGNFSVNVIIEGVLTLAERNEIVRLYEQQGWSITLHSGSSHGFRLYFDPHPRHEPAARRNWCSWLFGKSPLDSHQR